METAAAALYDYNTGTLIGPATADQIKAGQAAEARHPGGGFLIAADRTVIDIGSWNAIQPGTRSVYTS